jgi:hypothetical protein
VLSFKYRLVFSNRYPAKWIPCTINWYNKEQFNISYVSPITGLEHKGALVPGDSIDWQYIFK